MRPVHEGVEGLAEEATMSRSCWECRFQQIGGDTFLGLCRYFETKGQAKKAIPATVVDTGCKFWEAKDGRGGPGQAGAGVDAPAKEG